MVRRLALLLAGLFVAIAGFGYREAVRSPIVRTARVAMPDWPAGQPPVRILLMSDIHVQGPDMPPERLAGIVRRAVRLRPDLVVIAGDFLGERILATRSYSAADATAPLSALHAPLGVFAVLGNHDRPKETTEVRLALEAVGIRVLDNEAVEAGPIALAGFRSRPTFTLGQLARLRGARVWVAHVPDAFAWLPDSIPLMLAGHTHCGQIVLPWLGALDTGSQYRDRYRCGMIRSGLKTLIVTAGLGTSRLPLRIGAPPDMWLVTVGPASGRGGEGRSAP